MKHPYYILLAISLVLLGCQHSDPQDEYVDFSVYQSDLDFAPYKVTVSNIMDEAPWDTYVDNYITPAIAKDSTAAASPARKATSTDVISVVRNLVDMVECKSIVQVAGTYTSIDAFYNTITLSGKVFYPKNKTIKQAILVSHFTIGANYECPSETFALEGLLASKGYMVIVPDYIGYGVTKDLVHPYLQADLTAQNVIDMLFAVMPWAKAQNIPLQSDHILLFGYSQGGATTMHVQRLLETSEKYQTETGEMVYPIDRTYCGSGPYDVALTYDYSIKKDKTGIPCAVPMIIQGMSEGMANPLRMSYFFEEPLLSNYQYWLNSKEFTVKQINLMIDKNMLSEILTPAATDKTNTETQRLYKRLGDNSVNNFYYPVTPMYMFHSMDDETVPFVNSQHMQVQFNNAGCQNIVYDFDYYGSHTVGMLKFLIIIMKLL